MEQNNYIGLLLRAIDYKDNDKLLKILTPTDGVITAVIKGVKKASAKLKFAAQPFAFCEYTIVEKYSNKTVINASSQDNLFDLTKDSDIFFNASLMLEASEVALSLTKSGEMFVLILKCFNDMLYSGVEPKIASAYYLYNLLDNGGYMKKQTVLVDINKIKSSNEVIISYAQIKDLKEFQAIENEIPLSFVTDALNRISKEFMKRYECNLKSLKLI